MSQTVQEILVLTFQPIELVVEDESHKHAGHYSQALRGGTHLKIFIKSEKFRGLTRIQRHQLIYEALSDAIKEGLHAISIVAKTPEE